MKICTRCNKELPLSEFHIKNSKTNTRQTRCKKCVQELNKIRKYKQDYAKAKERRKFKKELGICRACNNPCIPTKAVCEKHYILDVCNKTLGKADGNTVSILLNRFYSNPYCPYTGEKLKLGFNVHLDHIKSKKNRPDLSNDIDNVEWVSELANLSKNGFNKDEFIEFCKLVASRF